MRRPRKSVLTAYLYLAFLGPFGAHRFYLKRPGSALFLSVLTITAVSATAIGLLENQKDVLYGGYFCAAMVLAVVLVDLVSIPGMVEALNGDGESRRAAVIAGNLDPSFQATLKHAGREEQDRPRKSALPDDYVRPWRKDKPKSDIYHPGDD